MKPKFNIGDEVMLLAGTTRGVILSCDMCYEPYYTIKFDGHKSPVTNVCEWELRAYVPPPPKPKFKVGDEVFLASLMGKAARGVVKKVNPYSGESPYSYDIEWWYSHSRPLVVEGYQEHLLDFYTNHPKAKEPKFKVGDEVYNASCVDNAARGIIREIPTANPPTYKVTWQYKKGPWESSVQFREDNLEFWANRPQKEEKMKNYQFNLTPAHIYGTEWEKRFNEIVLPKWEIVDFRPPVTGEQYISAGTALTTYYCEGNPSITGHIPPRFIVRPLEPVTDTDRMTWVLKNGLIPNLVSEDEILRRIDKAIREERRKETK